MSPPMSPPMSTTHVTTHAHPPRHPPLRHQSWRSLPAGSSSHILIREYEHGKVVFERTLPTKSLPKSELILKRERVKAGQEQRATGPGETIFKGHRSYDLMIALKLGVFHSIGVRQHGADVRDALPDVEDFDRKVKVAFPNKGSAHTPPHSGADFKWADYAPTVFRRLRHLKGIHDSDYLVSICGEAALR